MGTWLRNAIVVLASRTVTGPPLGWELLVWSPLQGITTAVVGMIVLLVFRQWLAIRLGES
jgi:hypothetical protein